MSNISFNPQQTLNAQNTFQQSTTGYAQGAFLDDPSSRNWLSAGIISSSVTQPMWGGMAISEQTVNENSNSASNSISLAGTANAINGFTVFNQANNGIITPGNTVQQYSSGMSISYFRMFSNARIGVKCSPTLANSLSSGLINQNVSWDFTQQELVPYSAGYSSAITGAVWASTNGGQTTFTVSTNPTTPVQPGDFLTVSGVVNTGGSSTGAFNGSWPVVSTTSTTIVVAQPAESSPGTYASGGTAAVTGGVLNVSVLRVNPNSKIVQYNSETGQLIWGVGPVAIIQI